MWLLFGQFLGEIRQFFIPLSGHTGSVNGATKEVKIVSFQIEASVSRLSTCPVRAGTGTCGSTITRSARVSSLSSTHLTGTCNIKIAFSLNCSTPQFQDCFNHLIMLSFVEYQIFYSDLTVGRGPIVSDESHFTVVPIRLIFTQKT